MKFDPAPLIPPNFLWPIGPKDRICGCKNLQVLYHLKLKVKQQIPSLLFVD